MAWVERNKSRGATTYRGRYRDSSGRAQTAGKSTSKREAMRMAQDEEHKLRSGSWLDPRCWTDHLLGVLREAVAAEQDRGDQHDRQVSDALQRGAQERVRPNEAECDHAVDRPGLDQAYGEGWGDSGDDRVSLRGSADDPGWSQRNVGPPAGGSGGHGATCQASGRGRRLHGRAPCPITE
jgi:hypothetical protein